MEKLHTPFKMKNCDSLMLLNLSKSSWKGVMEAVEKVKHRLASEMSRFLLYMCLLLAFPKALYSQGRH